MSAPGNKGSVFAWNAAASALQSGHTILLLMLVSRADGADDAGILTIACAIANLVLVGGKYGVRQFQVSDIGGQYRWETYVRARVLTLAAVSAALAGVLAARVLSGVYSGRKSLTVLCFCGVRLVDAAEDVFHGELQKRGKLALAAKIIVCRYLLYLTIFGAVYGKSRSLLPAAGAGAAVSFGAAIALNLWAAGGYGDASGEKRRGMVRSLLRECLPLGIMSLLSAYLSNAPKYVIDTRLSDAEQAKFNYVFMPVFAFCLLGMFLYQPMIVPYAKLWKGREGKTFRRMRLRQTFLLEGIIAAVLVLSKFAGIPVLSAVFGVDLKGYETHLLILVLGGGFFAVIQYYAMLITVMRGQKWLLAGFCVTSAVSALFGKAVVERGGLFGVSVFFAVLTGALGLYLRIVCAVKGRVGGQGNAME